MDQPPPKGLFERYPQHGGPVTFATIRRSKSGTARLLIAKGSWVESHPIGISTGSESTSVETLGDDVCYRTLAFGSNWSLASSTIETVSGLHVPSKPLRCRGRSVCVVAYGGRRISFLSGGVSLGGEDSRDECHDFEHIPVRQKHDDRCSSFLEVNDYVHAACSLALKGDEDGFLVAMGLVNNNVDIYGFRCVGEDSLSPTRLMCVRCEARCMTYGLCFRGWEDHDGICREGLIPPLIVASGTVFGEVLVWGAVDDGKTLSKSIKLWCENSNSSTVSQTRVRPAHRLVGHSGSVFGVKLCPNDASFIASTSDDRSVRLWRLRPANGTALDTERKLLLSARDVIDRQHSHEYTLFWTGWGHTARVWDVSFAQLPHVSELIVVSSGEDGTARVWNPLQSDKEMTPPLRGHRCESVWSVDVFESLVVTGGNDGTAKVYDLESRLRSSMTPEARSFAVPKDPPAVTESVDDSDIPSKKRKKKKKKAKSGQVVCGMEFYSKGKAEHVLVSTRKGSLYSLDIDGDVWTEHKKWCTIKGSAIDPSTGNCMAVHPRRMKAVLGTTDGWLVQVPLDPWDKSADTRVAYKSCHRPTQSVSFSNGMLVVLYARAVVLYDCENLIPVNTLSSTTPGIPLSFALEKDARMYVGDSRGNITRFELGQESGKEPMILSRAHEKEHVTAIRVVQGLVLSVGNDGCLTRSRNTADGGLQRLTSVPIANATGLRNIFSGSESLHVALGGYYGNEFFLIDNKSGYEFLRQDTGGRQRRQCFRTGFEEGNPQSYSLAILSGLKDGTNTINLHKTMVDTKANKYNIGDVMHAEEINDLCWIRGVSTTHLITGSNDCTVKLFELRGKQLNFISDLPPHESCVRGVCASSHLGSDDCSLLVTAGGKLSMEFYLLHSATSMVSSLCSYRIQDKSTIDHRMNVVRAIPLLPLNGLWKSHLVLAGDSDGKLHFVVVGETPTLRRTTVGQTLELSGRPILTIELLRVGEEILAFVGTTGGEVALFRLPARLISDARNETSAKCLGGDLSGPDIIIRAHQSGVNGLSAALIDSKVIVCSVGDDQCLGVLVFDVHIGEDVTIAKHVKRHQSASAQKSVKVVSQNNLCRVYTSGHDEMLCLWLFDVDDTTFFQLVASSPACTSGCAMDTIQGEKGRELIAVGGVGLELHSFDVASLQAAMKLRASNWLILLAGAGMSADSGLATYENAPTEYREMCDPAKLAKSPSIFQRFWLGFSQFYIETESHAGYSILDKWCKGGRLPNLKQRASSSWYVYTSNVDGHFKRFQSFVDSTCEIHGNANEYRCASGIGFASGRRRLGWKKWNDDIHPTDMCSDHVVKIDPVLDDLIESKNVLLCKHCLAPMRPNVLMFHDTDQNVLDPINHHRELYQKWESIVEGDVANKNSKLVILEIGCGPNVPAVRQESEEVLVDCVDKLKSHRSSGSVCLIRINPKDAEIDLQIGHECISLHDTTLSALNKIDFWLRAIL